MAITQNFFFFLMIRRPPRSTLFPLHDALPIYWFCRFFFKTFAYLWVFSVDCKWRSWLWYYYEFWGILFRIEDRKSTRLNSSHANISYAVFCLKKKISLHTHFLIYTHL